MINMIIESIKYLKYKKLLAKFVESVINDNNFKIEDLLNYLGKNKQFSSLVFCKLQIIASGDIQPSDANIIGSLFYSQHINSDDVPIKALKCLLVLDRINEFQRTIYIKIIMLFLLFIFILIIFVFYKLTLS